MTKAESAILALMVNVYPTGSLARRVEEHVTNQPTRRINDSLRVEVDYAAGQLHIVRSAGKDGPKGGTVTITPAEGWKLADVLSTASTELYGWMAGREWRDG